MASLSLSGLNPTRMHIITHLSDKYAKQQMNSENGWYEEEAGMADS